MICSFPLYFFRTQIFRRQSAGQNAESGAPEYAEEDRDVSQFLPIAGPSSGRGHVGHGKGTHRLLFVNHW